MVFDVTFNNSNDSKQNESRSSKVKFSLDHVCTIQNLYIKSIIMLVTFAYSVEMF